jgi:hypothetical protein
VRVEADFNVLAWWKLHEAAYPHLAQVAKDILAIQIAQVGVERVFNVAKDVIGARRHRLSAQTIQQIMVLKDTISCDMKQTIKIDEDEVPWDEVDDLYGLPNQFEGAQDSDQEIEEADRGYRTYESEDELLPVQKRPRLSCEVDM